MIHDNKNIRVEAFVADFVIPVKKNNPDCQKSNDKCLFLFKGG